MKVNKNIEKPSYVLGLPIQEFIILVGYFLSLFILNNILGSFGLLLGLWFWLFLVFSCWGFYLLLKWGARQNYPGFLLSLFSFRFLQGKKIQLRQFKITIKK
jgi:hypothetical protein